ncbi:MAG: molybdopterin-dependent oxidoreductase [Anaerolineales bacterium]|nr:molybdopterin-dependent oxidoreductase [Anaerolineales bacterium]
MTNSISDIVEANVLLVIGSNTTEAHPVLSLQMKKAVRQHGAKLILIDPRRIELAQFAHVHLRHNPGSDVAVINAMANVILDEGLENRDFIDERTEGFKAFEAMVRDWTPERAERISGVPADQIAEAARLYATAGAAAIFWAMGITQHTTGTDNVKSLANLAMLCGQVGRPGTGLNPLRGQNNVQGACDMGGLVNVFPGYQKVVDEGARRKFADGWDIPYEKLSPTPGLTVTEIMDAVLEGKVRAIYIMGENPMLTDPNLHHVENALRAVDFLVVQDIFINETAELADVILAGVSFAERSGTFTNTERRVHLIRPALESLGEAIPDWRIITNLADRMNAGWSYDSSAQIFDEMASLTPQYSGMSYARLESGGLQWPCTGIDHPGTQILHVGKFARGMGLFSVVDYIAPAELPDEDFPFILSTGRVLFHWHGGTLSRRSPGLDSLAPQAEVEINPQDAERIGVVNNQSVEIRSRRGQLIAKALITKRSPPGTVFMTFHYAEAAANLLTSNNIDPVAKIPEYKISAVQIEPLKLLKEGQG